MLRDMPGREGTRPARPDRDWPPILVAAVPPELPGSVLHRPRLERLLDLGSRRRLTTVVADAGFGKSTLLATWARGKRVAWHTVTQSDRDPAAMAAGLVRAISLELPGVGEAIGDVFEIGRGPQAAADESRRAEALAGAISSALEPLLVDDLVLVLDDLDVLGRRDAAIRLVASLCRQAPRRFHLMMSSRADPTFLVERLRLQGQVMSISGPELACTEAETSELLGLILGDDPGQLGQQLHKATAGWPAAIRLAGEALARAEPSARPAMLDRLVRTGDPVVGYFVEQVLAAEPPSVRRLVGAMALFDRFTAGMCEAIGLTSAADTLRHLERRGLFVQAVGDSEWYTIHPVVRTYAQERLAGPADVRRVTGRRAATWCLANGFALDALGIAMDQRATGVIRRILLERGADLLAAGHIEAVVDAASALVGRSRTPTISRLEGEARQVRGDWDGALACFNQVLSNGEAPDAGIAWRMGLIHHQRGELDRALQVYGSAVHGGDGDQADSALLRAWWAAALWLRGDAPRVRQLAADALVDATESGDQRALAVTHTVLAMLAAMDGDRRANDVHYLRALDHAMRGRDVLTQIRIRANRGSRFIEEAAYSAALTELDHAIGLAELTGFAVFHGLALSNRGEALYRLGRLDEARSDLEQARAIYQRLDSRLVAYPMGHLGDVYRERGDRAMARANYEEAISVSEPAGDVQGLVPSLAGLARVIADDEPARAETLARRAVALGPALGRVGALLALGWILLRRGQAATAHDAMTEAASLARLRRDRAGLAEALELESALATDPAVEKARLAEARAIWTDVGAALAVARVDLALGALASEPGTGSLVAAARSTLTAAGAEIPGGGRTIYDERDAAGPLMLRTMGGFEAVRSGRPVRAADWGSRRARDLVKILITRRGHRVPREQLIEYLWPDENPDRTARRLSVMISTARSVLDPDRRLDPVGGIGADRESVWLALPPGAVDVEQFLAAAADGLLLGRRDPQAGATALERAAAAYRGDFLEDDAYADWAVSLREECRATYLRVEHALARLASSAGDDEAAARHYRRVVEREPYDELAHLALVERLVQGRRPADARRAYRAYVAQMEELGVEAAPFPTPAVEGAPLPTPASGNDGPAVDGLAVEDPEARPT
jgi:ATP/maltotriose-dependent transcriptional regulator MalT/DNA-binding SARP family transcriptional activator